MPKEYSSTVELDNQVLFVINMHRGAQNPIKRITLVRRIYGDDAISEEADNNNPFDRAVRSSIQRLRKSGQPICSRPNGAGYYMATTRDEYEAFKTAYLGANFEKFVAVNAMDETADRLWGKPVRPAPQGQPSLFGAP